MNITDLNFEIKRKQFHSAAVIFPIFYIFLSKWLMVSILLALSVATVYLDLFRHSNFQIGKIINKLFGDLMRPQEQYTPGHLSGASFMVLGFFITALFFSKGLVITSWFILIISDSIAAIVGKKIGVKHSSGKTLEGAAAFFISAMLIAILCSLFIGYNTNFLIIILSVGVTTTFELYSSKLKLDDNVLIPIIYCSSHQIFMALNL